MQPAKRLDHLPHCFHLRIPSNDFENLLLDSRLTDQEPLDQLAVHEPEGLLRLAHGAPERAELVEGHLARGIDIGGNRCLQPHEEVLVFGVDECEEVD